MVVLEFRLGLEVAVDFEEQHPAELANALRIAVDAGILAHDVLDGFDRGREGHKGSGSGGFVEGSVDLAQCGEILISPTEPTDQLEGRSKAREWVELENLDRID